MKNFIFYLSIIFTSFVVLLTTDGCSNNNSGNENKTNDAKLVSTASGSCDCEADWFPHTQTPAPKEGIGSPFDTSSTTNCIFHQWAWQKFLWLTKPMPNGKTLFEDSMIQVTITMAPVAPVNNISLVLTDTGQAGGNPHGVLRSNPNYGIGKKSYTVYYGIFINKTLQDAALAMLPIVKKNPYNSQTFPVGSLELKTSWVDVNALSANDINNFYTTQAVINGTPTKVALLGIHVVGVVQNHPEFIWATFEHHDMAPKYNWTGTGNTDLPVTSASNMLFFQKGDTSSYQTLSYNANPPGNKNVFTVYKYGVPQVAGGGYMTTSQNETTPPTNHGNLEELNTCVAAQLADVWKNYFYNGGIWINTDGLTPQQQADTIKNLGFNIGSAAPNSIARGCLANFNITMETFQQDFENIPLTQMNVTSLSNCFGCHTSDINSASSPLYLSHIFQGYIHANNNKFNKSQIDEFRIRSFMHMKKARAAKMANPEK